MPTGKRIHVENVTRRGASLQPLRIRLLDGFGVSVGSRSIARGKSNQEIASRLFVSVKTVRNHVSNILLKLQVADRAQAVIRARDAGIGGGNV